MSRDRVPSEYDRDADRDDAYDRTPGDDLGAEDPADDSFLPGYVPYGWPGFAGPETGQDDAYGETGPVGGDAGVDGDDTWLDEGLITLLLVAGVALFLFPEPATSGLGILLIGAGVVAWLVDWAT